MKKHLNILICIVICQCLTANDNVHDEEFKTILGARSYGGYGAFDVAYTEIDSRPAVAFGARGGIIIGHNFALGVGGRGFANDYKYVEAINMHTSLVGGYGGFFAEWIIAPKFPVHLSVPVLAGVGGVAYSTYDKANSDIIKENDIENTETFFIFEPALELEFNVTSFFRFAIYGSARYTSDLGWAKTSGNVLDGYNAGLIFKFGKF